MGSEEIFNKLKREGTLSDGRLIPLRALKSARMVTKQYSMDPEALIGCILDFEEITSRLETYSDYNKQRRGYLIKCDEIYQTNLVL